MTNKNDIVSRLSDYCKAAPAANNSTSVLNICPRHRGKVGNRNTSAREMEKEKNDAALAKIFDDPSFPIFFIGGTSGSCAVTLQQVLPPRGTGERACFLA